MFRGLFKKHEEDDDIFEVDPVVEQRRKEKFSSPLIYDEEFQEKKEEKEKTTPKSKTKETSKPVEKKVNNTEKPKIVYQMTEVISPMNGLTKNNVETQPAKTPTKRPTRRKKTDDLVPVISPFFGDYEEKKPIDSQASLTSINEVNSEDDEATPKDSVTKVEESVPTVEDNLRNIAKIIEEEQDQLKIIEERTGEFKLNFESSEEDKKDSLIDEIDNNMSLDELIKKKKKKFKD